MLTPTKEQAEGHYADLSSKPFFGGLVSYFTSGPIVAMVWEGKDAAKNGRNLCHGSDSPESGAKETTFWFTAEELNNYTSVANAWVYEKGAEVSA